MWEERMGGGRCDTPGTGARRTKFVRCARDGSSSRKLRTRRQGRELVAEASCGTSGTGARRGNVVRYARGAAGARHGNFVRYAKDGSSSRKLRAIRQGRELVAETSCDTPETGARRFSDVMRRRSKPFGTFDDFVRILTTSSEC